MVIFLQSVEDDSQASENFGYNDDWSEEAKAAFVALIRNSELTIEVGYLSHPIFQKFSAKQFLSLN